MRRIRAFLASPSPQGSTHRMASPFSSAYYLAVNPDVATAGASAWLHYQVYGRPEGRSPHPLFDTDFLAASMPGVRREDVIDEYVTCPARWVLDPGPYVDCLRFMLEGEWDGYTNPLQQIVSHYLGGPWIHHRLLLIDAASDSQARARLRGACALLTSNAPGSRFVEVKFWALAHGKEFLASTEHETLCTVIPGYFLGANDREIFSPCLARFKPGPHHDSAAHRIRQPCDGRQGLGRGPTLLGGPTHARGTCERCPRLQGAHGHFAVQPGAGNCLAAALREARCVARHRTWVRASGSRRMPTHQGHA